MGYFRQPRCAGQLRENLGAVADRVLRPPLGIRIIMWDVHRSTKRGVPKASKRAHARLRLAKKRVRSICLSSPVLSGGQTNGVAWDRYLEFENAYSAQYLDESEDLEALRFWGA